MPRLLYPLATVGLCFAVFVGLPITYAQAPVGAGPAASNHPWSLSPPSALSVTVADLIGMTTFGSHIQGDGLPQDYNVVSPDGAHVAVVVKIGRASCRERV